MIITLNNSSNIYKKVEIALIDLDFIVKENYNTNTLKTYSREFSNILELCRLAAIIKRNNVTLTGIYGLTKIDDLDYTRSAKDNLL